MHAKRPLLGYALYLTAAVMFSLNGTVSKVLLESVGDAARLSQLRVTCAFLIMLAIVSATNRDALRIRRSELPTLAAFGIAGVAMTQWLYFVAIARMPIGIALLIEFTAPIMVVLWARLVRRESVRPSLWVGLALALAGLALVAQVWQGLTLSAIGVTAAFGAAVALAIYYLLGESLSVGRDPVSLTMWGFGFAAAMWALAKPWWTFPWSGLSGHWHLVFYMVVLGTVVPFWLVVVSMRHIGATGAAVIGMTEPVLASLIAWLLLGETLSLVQVVGGAVVLLGVAFAELARKSSLGTSAPTPPG